MQCSFLKLTHLLNKTFSLLFSLSLCTSHSPLSLVLSHPPRAQEVFRQAMRSPVVRLEVVPSSNRERYEKSLIGQLFGNSAIPDSSPRIAKTKEPPPPVKAKPVFKPTENPTTRLAEEAVTMEAAVSVSCFAPRQPVNQRHLDFVNFQRVLISHTYCIR